MKAAGLADMPVVVGGIIPPGGRAENSSGPVCAGSTRRRTSISRASWARSSTSSPRRIEPHERRRRIAGQARRPGSWPAIAAPSPTPSTSSTIAAARAPTPSSCSTPSKVMRAAGGSRLTGAPGAGCVDAARRARDGAAGARADWWASSPSTRRAGRPGGALLGDRFRMGTSARDAGDVFFRSLAARDELGGLAEVAGATSTSRRPSTSSSSRPSASASRKRAWRTSSIRSSSSPSPPPAFCSSS